MCTTRKKAAFFFWILLVLCDLEPPNVSPSVLYTVHHSRTNPRRPTRDSDPVVIPRHLSPVYLSEDELRQLQFKPNIRSIELSEGHKAKFNCTINIPHTGLEPSIIWKKNGKELYSDNHVGINELESITDGVMTVISTVMYVPFWDKSPKERDYGMSREIDMSPYVALQHHKSAESGCWRVPMHTECQRWDNKVSAYHFRRGRCVFNESITTFASFGHLQLLVNFCIFFCFLQVCRPLHMNQRTWM